MKLLRLGGVLGVVAALYVGWLMLRDAPLFKVEKVSVTGLEGPVVPGVRTRLEQAGEGMTTTHVDLGALEAAVAPYTVVKSLRVDTEFPHGLRIKVVEQLPVATLAVGGTRLEVAADGTVVHGLDGTTGPLPSLSAGELPRTDVVSDPTSLEGLELVDIAPTPLREAISRVAEGADGLTAYLRDGPAVYFGDTTRLHAKWAAVARVLADPESRGASYLDVRLPDRPAAGVDDPLTASGEQSTGESGDPSSEQSTGGSSELSTGQSSEQSSEPSTSTGA
jgi:cell division protein FtsQ